MEHSSIAGSSITSDNKVVKVTFETSLLQEENLHISVLIYLYTGRWLPFTCVHTFIVLQRPQLVCRLVKFSVLLHRSFWKETLAGQIGGEIRGLRLYSRFLVITIIIYLRSYLGTVPITEHVMLRS